MILHIEYSKFSVFKKQIEELGKKLNASTMTVNLHFLKGFSYKPYALLRRRMVNIAFTIDLKKLSSELISIVNKRKLNLTVTVDAPPSKRAVRKIKLVKGAVVVKPLNTAVEERLKELNIENAVVRYSDCDMAFTADVYNLCLSDIPTYQCAFSSCLGRTLYLSVNGDLSFCPERIQQTRIGNLFGDGDFFSHPEFEKVLEKQIHKRDECKEKCKLYSLCKGGCALNDTCELFKTTHDKTVKELQAIITQRKPLKEQNKLLAEAILKASTKGHFFRK